MKVSILFLAIFLFPAGIYSALAGDDETGKVNIYYQHFLLQSWPQNKRTVHIEIDTTLPPDTLVVKASGFKNGITQTTLQIKNMNGAVIEDITRLNPKSNSDEATYIFILSAANLSKINSPAFKIVLDNHQFNTPEVHDIALVYITKSHE